MAEQKTGKVCIYCGEDCSGRPRVRDGHGRYACQACVDSRKAARPVPATIPVQDPQNPLLLEDIQEPEPVGEMCQECGRRLPVGHVICMGCGTNITTGSQVGTNIKINRPKPVRATTSSIGVGAAVSAGASVIGLAIWFMASRATGEPTLVMAIVVGLLAGIGMLLPIRGSGRFTTGLISTCCALVVIMIGLLAFDPGEPPETFEYVWYSVSSESYTPEMTEVENLGEAEYSISGALWLAMGCCTAFAFGGSNPDPDAETDGASE